MTMLFEGMDTLSRYFDEKEMYVVCLDGRYRRRYHGNYLGEWDLEQPKFGVRRLTKAYKFTEPPSKETLREVVKGMNERTTDDPSKEWEEFDVDEFVDSLKIQKVTVKVEDYDPEE